MAVIDRYIDANISGNQVTKLLKAINANGAPNLYTYGFFTVAAGDDDGSVYRVFKSLDPSWIPLQILLCNATAMGAGAIADVGLHRPDLGAVLTANLFANDLDMNTTALLPIPGTAKNAMANVPLANFGKPLWELAGHTVVTKLEAYDLTVTLPTAGTIASTIGVLALFAQG